MRTRAAACGLLLHVLPGPAPVRAQHHLLDELVEVEQNFGAIGGATEAATDTRDQIAGVMAGLPPQSAIPVDPAARVAELNRFVFGRLGVRASQGLKDPENLLLSRVLARRQGYCVGIAALYLVLAERLGLPVYAVATPSHVFLRYDDGATRVNIETLQGGANIPDEQYVREHKITAESIRRGVFMRNLTADEFLAQVHNNLGVIYSERKDFEKAAKEYDAALRLDPRLPAGWYNHGNDLLRQGDHRRAVRFFSRSLRLYPTDVWALNNRGLACLKLGKREKARRDFEAALRIDPGFEQARKNLQSLR